MKNEAELTLQVLECYLKSGPIVSVKDLRVKIGVSEKKIKYILSVLEKRGYLAKVKKRDGYRLSEKIVMLL
jgi:predicted transcriptional regulator of viral defense system